MRVFIKSTPLHTVTVVGSITSSAARTGSDRSQHHETMHPPYSSALVDMIFTSSQSTGSTSCHKRVSMEEKKIMPDAPYPLPISVCDPPPATIVPLGLHPTLLAPSRTPLKLSKAASFP
ncbi:hypothetical protein AWENTII_012778 [Aspergillus wentii]